MIQKIKIFIMLCMSMLLSLAYANTNVHHLRVWASPDSTRLVLDLSHSATYKAVLLTDPDRIVIDIDKAYWSGNLEKLALKNTGVLKVTHENKNIANHAVCQITIELDKAYKFDVFMLKPNETYGHRLVMDLKRPVQQSIKSICKKRNDFLVMIDPGHGGEDPGAVGLVLGTQEKDVVLAVSKKLAHLINQQPGMRAILTRDGDYYLGLRKRMNLARECHADLFISIHADSFKNTKAHGASTFVLSQKGASSEAARWIAEHENRSDLIGGLRLEDKSNVLASVLLDLSQTANQAASEELADELLTVLGEVGTLHHRQVQRAGFMVLKAPDIPSTLVELGFLSHPKGEEKLRDVEHQTILARTLCKGIQKFLAQQPSPTHYERSHQPQRAH